MAGLWQRLTGGQPRPSPLARRIKAEGLTFLAPAKLARLEHLLDEVRSRVPGDFVEFGVAGGGSAILIAAAARKAKRAFYGYDVFAMIPAPTSDKDDAKSRARYEVIASGAAKGMAGQTYYGYETDLLGRVTERFARHGVPVDGTSVRLIRGLFEGTWPGQSPAQVAFAHIDCDWYDPVRYCLAAVADRMAPGAAILLDDYHDYAGCRTAVDEFLAARPDFTMEEGPNPILRRS